MPSSPAITSATWWLLGIAGKNDVVRLARAPRVDRQVHGGPDDVVDVHQALLDRLRAGPRKPLRPAKRSMAASSTALASSLTLPGP